jgi:hypothetical protein
MKVTVEPWKSNGDTLHFGNVDMDGNPIDFFPTTEGYLYYIFRTSDKVWVKHSKKLTKEEKQHVIKHESR